MDSMDLTMRPNPPLRRRNSIATSSVVPAKLTLPTKPLHAASFPNGSAAAAAAAAAAPSSSSSNSSQSFPAIDFELIAIKPLSYTSLKDLLPSTAIQSPTASTPGGSGGQSGYEISIRNRLVKQAAWAYLQPMSTSPDSDSGHFLHGLRDKISGHLLNNPVTSFLRFVTRTITRAFDWLLRAIRFRSFR